MFDVSGERAKMKTGDLLYWHQLSHRNVLEKYRVHQRMSAVFSDTVLQCHGRINGGDLGALPGKTKLYAFESLRDSYQLLSLSSAS